MSDVLTVLVLAADHRAGELIPQIETVSGVYVISQTDDSFLALARARALLPDVLVIDLSAHFADDAATVVDQARQLRPPSHVLVAGPGGSAAELAHTLEQLVADAAPPL